MTSRYARRRTLPRRRVRSCWQGRLPPSCCCSPTVPQPPPCPRRRTPSNRSRPPPPGIVPQGLLAPSTPPRSTKTHRPSHSPHGLRPRRHWAHPPPRCLRRPPPNGQIACLQASNPTALSGPAAASAIQPTCLHPSKKHAPRRNPGTSHPRRVPRPPRCHPTRPPNGQTWTIGTIGLSPLGCPP